MNKNNLNKRIKFLHPLTLSLKKAKSLSEKLKIIGNFNETLQFLQKNPWLQNILKTATPIKTFVIQSIIVIGEGPYIFQKACSSEKLEKMIDDLIEVENFYQELAGIVGYHYEFLKLLKESKESRITNVKFKSPKGINIDQKSEGVKKFTYLGIKSLPTMAFMFPVGGAGDRLNLIDHKTSEPLPAAQLVFSGKTLLARLIHDLQAKEYLYYKLFNKQISSPIIFMTSHEKNNHSHILDILDKNRWFDRPKDHFFFIKQPLVPVITNEGHWILQKTLKLKMKPGGHGVIWKLAKDKKALDWLLSLKRKKTLLRQINNPISGLGNSLLTFIGIGATSPKSFGFLSCPRLLHTAEGMNVLVEKKAKGGFEYKITNIEYTDFTKKGIADQPFKEGSKYSQFPANTNILFADIASIKKALKHSPFPGMTINLKHKTAFKEFDGAEKNIPAGRIESMMQNIADAFSDHFKEKIKREEIDKLKTFIVFNDRKKTISVTKRSYEPKKPIIETPDGCFYEILQNNLEMLANNCLMTVPKLCGVPQYIKKGPNLIFMYYPALGPLYQIIAQKIRGGKIFNNSELQLEITNLDIENLHLKGSLLILSDSPLGKRDPHGLLEYNENGGNCTLRNVRIKNEGVDRSKNNLYWQNKIYRKQSLKIFLHGCAEFAAENITIEGNHQIVVPDGWKYTARIEKKKLYLEKEKISKSTWSWKYKTDKNFNIILKKSGTNNCTA